MADDDLLRPTLDRAAGARSLYSSTGFFLSAFFGGPVGAGVYGLANSQRLGRLRQDLPVVVAMVAACFLLVLVASRQGWLEPLYALFDDRPARTLQVLLRVLALGCFAAIYFMHRQYFRSAQVAGVESEPGWTPGIGAVLLGMLANGVLAWGFQGHH